MTGFLDDMAAGSRTRAAAAMAREPLDALRRRCAGLPPPPALRVMGGFDVIAELKLRSPSQGALGARGHDVEARALAYAGAGAAAVSVLTEPARFDGSLEHLRRAAAALAPAGVPVMRKDFLVDPYQLYEARAAGASGVLLIVRVLTRGQLVEMLECARALGLFVLLEVFDEADIGVACSIVERTEPSGARGLEPAGSPLRSLRGKSLASGGHGHLARASAEGARRRIPDATRPGPRKEDGTRDATLLVGVNSRDLQTLEVVPGRLAELVSRLPQGCARVAESGLEAPADAARVARAGYDMALVGSALMRAADPGALLEAMLAAGRAARP